MVSTEMVGIILMVMVEGMEVILGISLVKLCVEIIGFTIWLSPNASNSWKISSKQRDIVKYTSHLRR